MAGKGRQKYRAQFGGGGIVVEIRVGTRPESEAGVVSTTTDRQRAEIQRRAASVRVGDRMDRFLAEERARIHYAGDI
jgi:hypothetical protein